MSDILITKEDGPRHGRYVARIAGIAAEAELVFTHRGPGLISADHTGAPDTMRGTGAARALVDALIADARDAPFHIIPLCPYVRAQYERNPDWQDVMTVPPGVMPPMPG
ncbi:GNAT family N-acetyltransferase [Sandarakinorhabdus rubra]|uniref:GNAT family N-acetyltransferase n=1 Tax=Sandarakinorhabdus rubra TaxID=2672568 RepID=UPI0013DCB0DE|nr:GNAT family N-acetyltransferase [Sandarakinorhabdus rubra]